MNRKSTYSAFTLVEMLVVMGIIVILMAVGITAGRYAINKANNVAHQNAVDQIYQALQAYYADERAFPAATDGCSSGPCTPQALIGTGGAAGLLGEYMDSGSFDGGTDATYYYATNTLAQSVLVCVSLGGPGDETSLGLYCNGNGFNDSEVLSGAITDKNVELPADATQRTAIGGLTTASDWNADTGDWGTASPIQ